MLAYNEASNTVTLCLFGVVLDILTGSSLPDKGERSEALFRELDKNSGGFRRVGPLIRVLRAYARAGKPDKAQEIAQEIRKKYGPQRLLLEGFVVQAYGVAGKLETADSLFRELMLRNSTAILQSGVHMEMMRAFSKSETKRYRAKEIFEQLSTETAFHPNTKVYNLLIASLAGSRNATEQAIMYYSQMLSSYRKGNEATRPNAKTYSSLVTAIKEGGSVDLGLKILEWQYDLYRETNSSDLRPSYKVYSAILLLLAKSNSSDKYTIAQSLWNEMRRLKVYRTESICRMTLRICADSELISPVAFSLAREAWKNLSKQNEVTSKSAFYYLRVCSKFSPNDRALSSRSAFEAFRNCCSRGLVDRRILKSFQEAVAPQPISFYVEQLFGNVEEIPSYCSRNIEKMHRPGSDLDL
eukprot:Nitzschia sp. Nitz4//scaffold338_size18487//1851//3086//NITZ4_008786-RA/size18487-processed-gene-0.10-mRNA-1//-1//CDS//3329548329//441//frame0